MCQRVEVVKKAEMQVEKKEVNSGLCKHVHHSAVRRVQSVTLSPRSSELLSAFLLSQCATLLFSVLQLWETSI